MYLIEEYICIMTNKEFIRLLKSDYLALEKYVKTWFHDYGFLHSLFQFIPPEFFFVLLLSVCTILILNTISPRTKQIHLFIAVLVSIGIGIFANKFALGRYRGWIYLKVGAMLLIPFYFYSLISYIIAYAYNQYKKNRYSRANTLEQSVHNLHNQYNEAILGLHSLLAGKEVNTSEIKDKLLNLKLTTEGILILLEPRVQNTPMSFAPKTQETKSSEV